SLRSWLYASERSMSPTPMATSTIGWSPAVSPDSADSSALAAFGLEARAFPSSEPPSDASTFLRGFDSGSAAGVGSSVRPLEEEEDGSGSAEGDDELEVSSAMPPPPLPPGGFVLLKAPAKRFQNVL